MVWQMENSKRGRCFVEAQVTNLDEYRKTGIIHRHKLQTGASMGILTWTNDPFYLIF
jgi:hypothetical protein